MDLERHKNKPWFDQECSKLTNKEKQAKLFWTRNPNDQSADNFTNIGLDTCKPSRKKGAIARKLKLTISRKTV